MSSSQAEVESLVRCRWVATPQHHDPFLMQTRSFQDELRQLGRYSPAQTLLPSRHVTHAWKFCICLQPPPALRPPPTTNHQLTSADNALKARRDCDGESLRQSCCLPHYERQSVGGRCFTCCATLNTSASLWPGRGGLPRGRRHGFTGPLCSYHSPTRKPFVAGPKSDENTISTQLNPSHRVTLARRMRLSEQSAQPAGPSVLPHRMPDCSCPQEKGLRC